VSLGDFLEPAFSLCISGIHVRMVLAGELSVRLLDFIRRSVTLYPENRVVILSRHGKASQPSLPSGTGAPCFRSDYKVQTSLCVRFLGDAVLYASEYVMIAPAVCQAALPDAFQRDAETLAATTDAGVASRQERA